MLLAPKLPWHTQAKAMAEREMGGIDPSHLFVWPFARVLAVYFLSAAGGAREVSRAEAVEIINRRRAAKGLPPIS